MEGKSQRTPTWVWIVLVVGILVSLGCGLLFGGIAGYLLGSRNACWPVEDRKITPQFGEPDEPGLRILPNPNLAPQMPGFHVGATVTEVTPGTAAEKVGIQVGDVIYQIDGEALPDRSDLAAAIRSHKPGDRVTLTIWRPGQMLRGDGVIEVKVTLGEHPDEKGVAFLGVTVTSGMFFRNTE